MKAVRYDQLYDALALQLPVSCSKGVMLRALRTAGRRFCMESRAWRQNLTPITTVAAQLPYAVTNEWSADIVGIFRVGLRTAAEIALDADADGTELSPANYNFLPDTQKIKFITAPTQEAITNGLLVKAILVPQYNSDEVADWFMSLYTDGILGGALVEICGMPGPLYSADKKRDGQRMFNNGIALAARNAVTGFTSSAPQIRGGYSLL